MAGRGGSAASGSVIVAATALTWAACTDVLTEARGPAPIDNFRLTAPNATMLASEGADRDRLAGLTAAPWGMPSVSPP